MCGRNYVLQNPGRGRNSKEIARLEHINGDEPYSTLWARVHNWQSGHIESFSGRLRDECLNVAHFISLDDASHHEVTPASSTVLE